CDAFNIFQVRVNALLIHQAQAMPRWPGRARDSCNEPHEEWGKMLEINLCVNVQRALYRHADRLQLLRGGKLNFVVVSSGMQRLQRSEIIHGVCQRGLERFFEVDTLRQDGFARRSINAPDRLPGKEDMGQFVPEEDQP